MLKKKASYFRWITAAVVFVIFMVCSAISAITEYAYDAEWYWTIADPVFEGGKIHLLSFPETFRGYFLPVVIQLFKRGGTMLGHGYWGWRVFVALMLAALLTFIFPVLFSKKIDGLIPMLRVVLCECVLLWVWGNYLQYPLSDLAAVVFLSAGVASLKSAVGADRRAALYIGLGLIGGIFLYAAYNTRVVFGYGAVFSIIVFAIYLRRNLKRLLMVLLPAFVGALLIALPQMMINHQYTGAYAPKVYTEQLHNYERSIEMQQLYWGITYDRYETYDGDAAVLANPQMFFRDPEGETLLQQEGLVLAAEFSKRDYLHLIIKHPLDMAGIYMRHLISAMTPFYREVFVHDLYAEKGVLITISILLWLLSGVVLTSAFLKRKLNMCDFWFCAAIGLPGVMQMFGAVEIRFFLPLYLLSYFGVFVKTDYNVLRMSGRKIFAMLLIVAALYLSWIAIVTNILLFHQNMPLLINF